MINMIGKPCFPYGVEINKEDKKMIIELICNEQTHMIVKDHTKYDSDKYKKLEELKIKIKDF